MEINGTADYEALKMALNNGIVMLIFEKKNGNIRMAKATTRLMNIPSEHHPKGTCRKLSENVVRFYDLDKEAWRSLRCDSLLGFNVL